MDGYDLNTVYWAFGILLGVEVLTSGASVIHYYIASNQHLSNKIYGLFERKPSEEPKVDGSPKNLGGDLENRL